MRNGGGDEHRRQRVLLTLGVLAADAAALSVALLAAHRLASVRSIWYAPVTFPVPLWLVVPIAIALFAMGRLYVLDELFEGSVEYGRIVYGCTLAALSVIVLGFWGKFLVDVAPSRTLIVLVWLFSLVTVGGTRFALRRLVRFLRRRGHLTSRAVIVGLGASGLAFARHFEEIRHSGIKVVGFIDDFLPPGTLVTRDLKVLGPPSALDAILEETRVREVIIVPTATAWESFQELMRRVSSMNGYTVRLAPGSRDLLATTLRAHQLASIPMLTVERARITGLDRILKSALDYAVTLLLLPYAIPAVILAACVFWGSGTRPFQRLRIIGREGVPFSTFVLTAEGPNALTQRIAKRMGVHRLPQLLSVLLGRMSIVGPRPIPLGERRDHTLWLPSLLTVNPGLIGGWTVRPASSREDEMDQSLFYIRNYTIWFDVEMLFRTALRILSANGREGTKEGVAPRERAAVHR